MEEVKRQLCAKVKVSTIDRIKRYMTDGEVTQEYMVNLLLEAGLASLDIITGEWSVS